MISRATRSKQAKQGLTLIELILAVGLLSMLMVAVFQLFDSSLSLWQRGETQRGLLEQATAVGELVGRDLRNVEGGTRGDLLVEWVGFDTDGDRVVDARWPRLRLVRRASAAEIERSFQLDTDKSDQLVEVFWCVVPASKSDPDARSEGVLWRGERLLGEQATFFEDGFFPRSGYPPTDTGEEVSGGLLWMGPLFATQTTIVHDGWKIGEQLEHAATSWDAWRASRPDPDVHPWNEEARGMPGVDDRALLPRRIRLELEFERPSDRRRRTRLGSFLAANENVIRVEDGRRIPQGEDDYVLIDAEWMKVVSVSGDRVVVRRGARGSNAARHEVGAMVHYGARLVREVRVALYREDWDL